MALRGAHDDDLGDAAFLRLPVLGEGPLQHVVGALGLALARDLDVGGQYVARNMAIARMAATTATIQIATTRHGRRLLARASRSVIGPTGLA